jgi:mannose-1-phosphate guanylyltransferase
MAMMLNRHTWALVLAAGDGTRLASLTADAQGNAVPKQYCALHGDSSLLQEALQRARTVVPRARVCVIVAEQHRRYWQNLLWSAPERNVIVQPQNRGTAHGILLAVLHILERDPQAQIVCLPADHHVRDETVLARSLSSATTLVAAQPHELLLLGIEPDEADPELGYIVPGAARTDTTRSVQRFVEKPEPQAARALIAHGALWNSFIFAARGQALLDLLRSRLPQTVAMMAQAVAEHVRSHDDAALQALYARLETVDFSRAIVQGFEARLRVLAAGACGWTDLGTPRRVSQALQRLAVPATRRLRPARIVPALVNLARQLDRAPRRMRELGS